MRSHHEKRALALTTSSLGMFPIAPKRALEFAIMADYKSLFDILTFHPRLMFENTKAQDITGEKIETTVLKYAMFVLDTTIFDFCLRLCRKNLYTHPELISSFFRQAREVTSFIDLKGLFDSYKLYLHQFNEYAKGLLSEEELLKTWLNVGKAQRHLLPRHMLREMCSVVIPLQIIIPDLLLVLLSPTDKITTRYVNEISKHDKNSAILFKVNDTSFIFCQRFLSEKNWRLHPLDKLPFKQISFPNQYNQIIKKAKEIGVSNINFNYMGSWLKEKCQPHFVFEEDIVIDLSNGHFQSIVPLPLESTLGVDFSLARGNSCLCTKITKATGENGQLKLKAEEDLNSLRWLQKRNENYVGMVFDEMMGETHKTLFRFKNQ